MKQALEQAAKEYAGSNYMKNHQPKIWQERYDAWMACAKWLAPQPQDDKQEIIGTFKFDWDKMEETYTPAQFQQPQAAIEQLKAEAQCHKEVIAALHEVAVENKQLKAIIDNWKKVNYEQAVKITELKSELTKLNQPLGGK